MFFEDFLYGQGHDHLAALAEVGVNLGLGVKVVETLVRFDEPPPFKLGQRVTAYFERP